MFAEGFVLTNLILAANVQASVEESETALRHIAYSTAEDDQGRFTRLIGFRRDVGSCYDDLKFMNTSVMDYMGLPHVFQYTTMVTNKDMIDKQRKEGLTRPICAHLDELEKKLDAVKEDLNEELQVTIGTVQVREAQLMREQTRITARQTTWTVALTVLAAVYLPMTLVTGIFGMNITEISSEASAPNAWWAVGTWVVVAGLTVAGILSYVAISKLRARKRKSDLEANDECQKSSDKGEADVGKWFSKTSKDWIGLKQKAKMVWTPKQE
jgi:Mg2+ and Co2+ transporter CorA